MVARSPVKSGVAEARGVPVIERVGASCSEEACVCRGDRERGRFSLLRLLPVVARLRLDWTWNCDWDWDWDEGCPLYCRVGSVHSC